MPSYESTFPGPAHYEVATRGLRSLSNASNLINKAEACGVDCQQYRQGHEYLGSFLTKYINQFHPDRIVPPDGTGVDGSYGQVS
jgi:hypothetical protein